MLAEWYADQRIWDARFYKFVVTQYAGEAPAPGDLFPLLKDTSQESKEQSDSPDDDELIFHLVTSSLTNNK